MSGLSTSSSVVSPHEQAAPAANPISYFTIKDFNKSLQVAFLSGGQSRKRHDKVKIVLGSLGESDPFITVSLTNHGETRIKHCLKYDLGDGWRLVTFQANKTCFFLFVGDHDDTERWLDGHKGETFGVKDGRLVQVPGVGDSAIAARPYSISSNAKPLVDLLDESDMNHLLDGLSPNLVRKICAIEVGDNSAELYAVLGLIADSTKAEFVRSVLTLLLEGNVDGARAHIDLSQGRIAPVEEVDAGELIDVLDSEGVRRLRVGSPEYEEWLKEFEQRSSWHEWFLFLHPDQERVVKADYPGAAQLSGVSGSGKTCVVVRRAMRLAEMPEARVLILTLNRSLAGLLRQLVAGACVDSTLRERITVTSFFDLASTLLVTSEPDNARHYEDVTWKLGEHVDEVFREFYRCWANNEDATTLLSLHQSMNARGVSGETYVRDEFDWIRSAVTPNSRNDYLSLERTGRKIPLLPERRQDLLESLQKWEEKMRAVGVIDYLGLTSALARHMEKIVPSYTHVLVDEAQDFGTTELRVVRQFVAPGPNDIFLCGDVAQTVLPKHRSLANAGIMSIARERIQQNYRNSRQILAAAYELLKYNLHDELFDTGDFEILDPRFANFSGPLPMALAADSLEEEIAFVRTYAATRLQQGALSVCVAFAGFSSRDVKAFANRCGVTALDGAYNPNSDRFVFSDLEQTKGYEFETLIIVNCCDGVLPAKHAPAEEAFRDSCKLYVAMTRAKRELILSFNGAASPWILAVGDTMSMDLWSSVETLDRALIHGVPDLLPEVDPVTDTEDAFSLNGRQFLYTSWGLGLSLEAQEKLSQLVDGRGLLSGTRGQRLKWPTIAVLSADLNEGRRYDGLFGAKVADELRAKLSRPSA